MKLFNNFVGFCPTPIFYQKEPPMNKDEEKRVLKLIQQDAVHGIQYGWEKRQVFMFLNSHVNIDVEKAMKRCKEMESSEVELMVAMEKCKKKHFMESQKYRPKEETCSD
jgi:hypothetical protein